MPLNIQSSNTQKVRVKVQPRTAPTPSHPNGLPASIEPGSFAVSVVQGLSTVVLTDNSGNPLPEGEFYAFSEDGPITPDTLDTVYALKADADLGSGVTDITDTVTYHVTGEQASDLGTTASSPEPK